MPLVGELERERPDASFVISAYSPTGFAAAQRLFPQHQVILFPLDFSFVVDRVVRTLDPRLVVIVEADLWPNFLRRAIARQVPVAVVNGKMSERSFRLHTRLPLFSGALRRLAFVAVQNDEHASRFARLGVLRERLHVTGNMKYDLTQPPAGVEALRREVRLRLGYGDDEVLVLGGSLHAGEERPLLEAFKALGYGALALVPRYPSDAARMAECARAFGHPVVLKSEIDRGAAAPGSRAVLLVDTLGELRQLYAVADVAFVGGSLFDRGSSRGGHNLMEPAVLGVPVLFGPHNTSFAETARALEAAGGGLRVQDAGQIGAALTALCANREARLRMGASARAVVLAAQGATARNSALLRALLDAPAATLPVTPAHTHNAARER